ncbi:MAG: hypothetical protein JEZ11_27580 [Desulfobacterales bacterium]|nr:hypothetical protein [Desulfobacterales bacterium]
MANKPSPVNQRATKAARLRRTIENGLLMAKKTDTKDLTEIAAYVMMELESRYFLRELRWEGASRIDLIKVLQAGLENVNSGHFTEQISKTSRATLTAWCNRESKGSK